MRAYLITTAAIFGLITAAHIWRMAEEGRRLATEPIFMVLTIASASLCLWGVSLMRRQPPKE